MREKQRVVDIHSNNRSWTVYTRDTAVRQADVLPEVRVPEKTTKEERIREERRKRWEEDVRKHAIEREIEKRYVRSNGMYFAELIAVVVLLAVLLGASVFLLYQQSAVTATVKSNNAKKQEYQTLVHSNDILESTIELSIDPKAIFDTATQELQMGYPVKSQVIYYQRTDRGLVYQMEDIPEE